MIEYLSALKRFWTLACTSETLRNKPVACVVLGEHLVLFRTSKGDVVALHNRCPHRGAPLSEGWVEKDHVVCPFHGWHFDEHGQCVKQPGCAETPIAKVCHVKHYPVCESQGFVWVYLGPLQDKPEKPFQFPYPTRRKTPPFRA
jgi:phenylpropionate dioxygenase-like ring-hydroxylating dioxygenase large terminal subunit